MTLNLCQYLGEIDAQWNSAIFDGYGENPFPIALHLFDFDNYPQSYIDFSLLIYLNLGFKLTPNYC